MYRRVYLHAVPEGDPILTQQALEQSKKEKNNDNNNDVVHTFPTLYCSEIIYSAPIGSYAIQSALDVLFGMETVKSQIKVRC